MYILKTKSCFDSAHFLKGYEGKCSNIHGHRWKVEVEIAGDALKKEGSTRDMLFDFSDLKESLKKYTDAMDHVFIIERGSLKETTLATLRDEGFRICETDFRPTAENFAKYFFDLMKKDGYPIRRCLVYETPENCAAYEE